MASCIDALAQLMGDPRSADFVGLREKLIYAISCAGCSLPSTGDATTANTALAVITKLSDVVARAQARVAEIVHQLPADERMELGAASVRGPRGFDMRVFACLLPVHGECEEHRGMMAEAARASL